VITEYLKLCCLFSCLDGRQIGATQCAKTIQHQIQDLLSKNHLIDKKSNSQIYDASTRISSSYPQPYPVFLGIVEAVDIK
jgi:hypothetical protein